MYRLKEDSGWDYGKHDEVTDGHSEKKLLIVKMWNECQDICELSKVVYFEAGWGYLGTIAFDRRKENRKRACKERKSRIRKQRTRSEA